MSGPERVVGEGLGRCERVRRRADYLRCYQRGRRKEGSFAVLYSAANGLAHPRIGITASRKLGKAAVRQKLKRRVREIYRRSPIRRRLGGVDVVVHLKPGASRASFAGLREDLLRLLRGLAARQGSGP